MLSLWAELGDFARTVYPNSNLTNTCDFTLHTPKTLKSLSLCGYSDGSRMLSIGFVKDFKVYEFSRKFITNDIPIDACSQYNRIIYFQPKKKSAIYGFLKQLLILEPLVKQILPKVCRMMQIDNTLGLTKDYLLTMDFQDALKLTLEAQNNGMFDLIFDFVQSLWQKSLQDFQISQQSYDNLYTLASSVVSNSPHYLKAQDLCVEILMRPKQESVEQKSLSNDDDDDLLLERKFMHALNGSQQDVTDMFFKQLCGFQLNSQINIRDIKPNAQTLICLARIMRNLC